LAGVATRKNRRQTGWTSSRVNSVLIASADRGYAGGGKTLSAPRGATLIERRRRRFSRLGGVMNRSSFGPPVRPSLWFVLAVSLFSLNSASTGQAQKAADDSPAKEAKSSGETPLEVRFTDNSVLKLILREERVEFSTMYGKLYIPAADIRRIDFGLRVPEETARRIDSAIADLGNPQFRRREQASAILLGLREKAYPAVLKATKNGDMEIASRADELIKKFRDTVPAELLQTREFDVLHTDNSRISGRIEAATLRATTTQFGDVTLKLADVFTLSAKGTEPEPDTTNVAAGPINMVQYQAEIGKTFTFRITGNVGGSVWGTDLYTTDSTLASVAVHTGLLQSGQTGVIKVSVVPSPQVFVGSTRNGVSSAGYGQYPAAYRVHR
jgi:hypothetical protein